ncbi:MAG: hypothetical protein HQ402_00600 [Parcubacteria group bacterium]|nr:hypothetical protein [Parcubacteria group bacterium]
MNNLNEKDIKDMRTLFDFAKFISTNIADQIKQADTKAVGVLGVLGIVTGALLSRLNTLKSTIGVGHSLWVFLFAFSLIMIVITLKFIIRVVYPRTSLSKKKNLLFFKDIATFSHEEYVEQASELSPQEFIRETHGNSHNLACVADAKYKALRHAMIFTVITIIWTVAMVALF